MVMLLIRGELLLMLDTMSGTGCTCMMKGLTGMNVGTPTTAMSAAVVSTPHNNNIIVINNNNNNKPQQQRHLKQPMLKDRILLLTGAAVNH